MLSCPFDCGKIWPDDERSWIWNNNRTLEEILNWLRPVDPEQREKIDLADPDAIIECWRTR